MGPGSSLFYNSFLGLTFGKRNWTTMRISGAIGSVMDRAPSLRELHDGGGWVAVKELT